MIVIGLVTLVTIVVTYSGDSGAVEVSSALISEMQLYHVNFIREQKISDVSF
jgi:hypothetical protein